MAIYELTVREAEAYDKFIKELPKKYKNKTRKLIFSMGSGIGIAVTVKVGKKKKDITDYSSW